ncbi:MAG: FAD-binding oxidoreductase [Planctomycetes bacterium]|nr:FAD-binding oxidoreductase [Planctomycetota bacterium]MCH9726453.1 FAD-binding oxidoreductase [Planctomycetota bacterium]MCH9778262.1 FAD-binding oxidoreductase [Planctomycetota bacterium]MCH9792619.1 FAD-binding oxidoreductase [Planctomycetota bacterium]
MSSLHSGDLEEFVPTSQIELSRFITENAIATQKQIFPAGGRTSLSVCCPASLSGTQICTSQLNKVIDYPVRDMTITVEAGMRIDQLNEIISAEGQRLPIDVPQSNRATLGGVIATNTSGPKRFSYGTIRDYVIGISAIDGKGNLFKSGGRVVKNVAGYDLKKMLVGSLGTLAVISQVSLNLRPKPESMCMVWFAFDSYVNVEQALNAMITSGTRPTAVEYCNSKAARQIAAESRLDLPSEHNVICISYEGPSNVVKWQANHIIEEWNEFSPLSSQIIESDHATRLYNVFTEYQTSSDDPVTLKAVVLPSQMMKFVESATQLNIAIQAHAADGIVFGHLPDSASSLEDVKQILSQLKKSIDHKTGYLTVYQCESEWSELLPLFCSPPPGWSLMKQLKNALDPDQLLNSKRFTELVET